MITDPATLFDLEAQDRLLVSEIVRWHYGRDAAAYDEHDRPTAAASPVVRAEVRELLRATPAQQAVVRLRLPALVAAQFDEAPGAIARAAERISTTRANVYRLLERMEEMGPVSALVPQNRRARRPSVARDGFGQPIDGWIDEILSGDPESSIAEIDRALRSRLGTDPEGAGVEVPALSSLKRRVHRVRAAHVVAADGAAHGIGGLLLIDYCRINIDLGREAGADRARVPGMIVAVDEGAKVVVGFGLWFERVEEGYEALVKDAARRLSGLAGASARIAPVLDVIRWVVPPELQARADGIGSQVPASRRPRVALVPHGDRRSGSRLVSLVGDHIGDVMLLVRPSADDGGPRRSHVRSMHSAASIEAATFIVSAAVDDWNAKRLATAPGGGGSVAVARRNAAALATDFGRLFASVLS